MILQTLSLGTYTPRLLSTAISAIVIIICMIIIYQLFKSKFYTIRKKRQFRSRVAYLGILIFLIVLTRVWVDGFTHIFTMLSLVAAGLIVSNKESIMNFTGWLIINWRGIFSEGDYVQIQNIVGYVDSIRMFHFKLYACQSLDNRLLTGKVIKIPNSTIITTPITLFSLERHFSLKTMTIMIDMNDKTIDLSNKLNDHVQILWTEKYKNNNSFYRLVFKGKSTLSASIQTFQPSIQLKPVSDKERKINVVINIYCLPDDEKYFDDKIMQHIIALELPES
jgi:small-conductance mechanosensitive channel